MGSTRNRNPQSHIEPTHFMLGFYSKASQVLFHIDLSASLSNLYVAYILSARTMPEESKFTCIMGSHNFKGIASSVQCIWHTLLVAVQFHCNIQPQEGEDLWHMTTCNSTQRWPHNGMWHTKNRRGREITTYQRQSSMLLAHSLHCPTE